MSIKIAILLSGRHGRGSNMQAIARACAEGRVDGRVALVLGTHPDSPALARAREMGLATGVLPALADDAALRETLAGAEPDLICLAGYLRRLPAELVEVWAGRVMNTHPALLPAFGGRGMYGAHVHQAALDYGVKVSGCTVHFVDETYDTGPIILQSPVPVLEGDTAESLAARVLVAEHAAYPAAVSLFAEGRLRLQGRRVLILPPPQTSSSAMMPK